MKAGISIMQLLHHFKELTIRPKNAKELKGLILQLAIQGKLTANWRAKNTDIEPASELLKRIQKEKEELVKEKKLKRDKVISKLTTEEIPFNIAETWIWTRLGEIGTTNVGLTYKPAHKNETGVPVLRSSNIQEGELCLKDLVRVNTEYREKDIIEEGDLLICARNGSRRLVGKCTIIGLIDEVMVFGAFMAIFRSNFNPYLQLFIQSPQYRSKLDGVETTTINQITQGNLKATTVPLPPLEEQKEIVNVVETLFKEVEQLEQLTVKRIGLKEDFVTSVLHQLFTNNATQEWSFLQDHFKSVFNETTNIKKLRETVLQLAVQGKLTQDWRVNNPNTEDASQLLKRIQEEKAQLIAAKKIKKEKALPPITKDEIPYELPEGWVWCFSQVLFKYEQGVQVDKNLQLTSPADGYERFLRIVDFTQSTDDIRYVPNPGEKYLVSEKNLVMVRYGASAGFIGSELSGILANNLFKIHYGNLNKDYVKLIFESPYFNRELKLNARGGAMPAINFGFLNKFKFPLAPLEEQKAIVKKVKALMGLCDALEQEVQQSQTHSEQLMQSVLREVFEGNSKVEI